MDVDSVDSVVNVATDGVQPIQRARRTYASKPKLATVLSDEGPSKLHSTSMASLLPTAAAPQSSSTTATSTYQPGLWRGLLADIDKDSEMGSDDDNDRIPAPSSNLSLKLGKDAQTPLSSPPSPRASRSTSRQARPREQISQQYSANTSFASGTSGAISSPSSRALPLTSPLELYASDPLHSDEDADDTSPISAVPSSKQGTISLRDKTPDSPARSRALEPTVFQSPIRSFSHATAQTKERKRPKFVGNDEDSDEEMVLGGTHSDVQDDKMNDIESQLGWVTDGSDKGKSRRRKSDKTGANNVKKPSKKQVVETKKETARMRAERDLDVQGKAVFEPLSFASHFEKRAEMLRKSSSSGRPLSAVPPAPKPFDKPTRDDPAITDPISNFSSSPGTALSEPGQDSRPGFNLEKARQDLRQKKLQAAQAVVARMEDDSSDLEIVPETPGNAVSPLDPAKKLELIGKQKHKQKRGLPNSSKAQNGSAREMTKEEHNRLMRERAAVQSKALMEHKKADFLERGGQLTKQAKAAALKGQDVLEFLDKAKVLADAAEQPRRDSDEDDSSYEPEEDQATLQGSSPSKIKPKVLVPDSSVVEGAMADVTLEEEKDDVPIQVQLSDYSETEDENEAVSAQPAPPKRRNVVLSDDEQEDMLPESDGENISPYIKSKESPRFDLLTSLTRPVDSTKSRTPLGEILTEKGKDIFSDLPLSPISPIQTLSPTQRDMKVDIPSPAQQSPLKRGGSSLLPAFEQSPSKRSTVPSSPFAFSAMFGAEDDNSGGPGNRSSASSVGVKPVNFGEISTQLFFSQPSPSQRASPVKRSRDSQGKADPLAELRANNDDDDFLLSQDGPLGRIELSTQQARELQIVDQVDADAAFREGEEERRKKLRETEANNEPKWINDAGLFTQTKPAEVPWSLTQNLLSQTSLFFPQFTDLDAEQMLSQRSPGKTPSRRLRRKGELADHVVTPPLSESVASPKEKRLNALEYLMKPKKHVNLDVDNQFVQGEAEESDDELALGFTGHRGDDEDAQIDPEEEAKYVDDKKMSKDEIREEAIIEKHREHIAEDDAEIEKIHQAAVDGRLRKGKRGHGFIESDSSDDEGKARGKKFKKRKVVGTDHLDDIARNPDTVAFYQTYMNGLPGTEGADLEDDEFKHLNNPVDDVEADADLESDNGDEEMESGSEAGGQDSRTISTNEVLRRIQEKADNGEDLVDDTELIDADDYVGQFMPSSDAPLAGDYDNIRAISPRKRPGTKIIRREVDVLLGSRFRAPPVDETHALRLAAWAKQNAKAREITARGIASAAVTGHVKAPPRAKIDKPAFSTSSNAPGRAPARSETMSSLTSKLGKKKDAAWE